MLAGCLLAVSLLAVSLLTIAVLSPATLRGRRAGPVKRRRRALRLTPAIVVLVGGGPAKGGLAEAVLGIAGLLETLLRIYRGLVVLVRLRLIRLAGARGQETTLPWSALAVALLIVALLTVAAGGGFWLAVAVLAGVGQAVTTAGRGLRAIARFTAGPFRAVTRPVTISRLAAVTRLGPGTPVTRLRTEARLAAVTLLTVGI